MTIREAFRELSGIPKLASNNSVESLREKAQLRNRYIEPPEKIVGKNVGLYSISGQELRFAISDVGRDELMALSLRQNEPLFILKEKADVDMTSRARKGEILMRDILTSTSIMVVPKDFTYPGIMKPGFYVISKRAFDGSDSIFDTLRQQPMVIDGMDVIKMKQTDLEKMYGNYAEAVMSKNRVLRALEALMKK